MPLQSSALDLPGYVWVLEGLLCSQPLVWVENQETLQQVKSISRHRRLEKTLQRHLWSGEGRTAQSEKIYKNGLVSMWRLSQTVVIRLSIFP